MNRAQMGGRDLEYEVRGAGEPVVLVHGSHIADAFAPLLGEPVLTARYQLIRYHRRGFAGSTHPDGPLSIMQQAADCHALMRHLGVPRAHIVGHSYGGAIALQLALDAPEAVHSLALLEPALLMVPSVPQLMDAMGPVFQLYEAGNKAGAVDGFLQAVVGPEHRRVLDRVLPGASRSQSSPYWGRTAIRSGQAGSRCTTWCRPGGPRRRPSCLRAPHMGDRSSIPQAWQKGWPPSSPVTHCRNVPERTCEAEWPGGPFSWAHTARASQPSGADGPQRRLFGCSWGCGMRAAAHWRRETATSQRRGNHSQNRTIRSA
jgi:pimeloyl-ACP methyl ester carboxylesterase